MRASEILRQGVLEYISQRCSSNSIKEEDTFDTFKRGRYLTCIKGSDPTLGHRKIPDVKPALGAVVLSTLANQEPESH